MVLQRIASEVGKGVFAGIGGTVAMTASSTAEMKLRGGKSSTTPAEALCTLLGVETLGETEKNRLTNLVHWSYGTGLGALRGLIAAGGIRGVKAAALFFGLVWGGEQLGLPALKVSPPITEWTGEMIASDVAHHLVYALGTTVGYELIQRG
ncbi:MAG: hypothetical protein GEV04_13325 [Actinophytocola sp.]|nr:hypothetical protein [Actinophytocola sp.]